MCGRNYKGIIVSSYGGGGGGGGNRPVTSSSAGVSALYDDGKHGWGRRTGRNDEEPQFIRGYKNVK